MLVVCLAFVCMRVVIHFNAVLDLHFHVQLVLGLVGEAILYITGRSHGVLVIQPVACLLLAVVLSERPHRPRDVPRRSKFPCDGMCAVSVDFLRCVCRYIVT